MTKQEYIQAIDDIIKEAEKDNDLYLMSILYSLCGAIMSDSLEKLSDYTAAFSMEQTKIMYQKIKDN